MLIVVYCSKMLYMFLKNKYIVFIGIKVVVFYPD